MKSKIKIQSKYKTLLSNTLAFTISNFASKLLVFLLLPLYTSILTTSDYGIADLITNTVNVLYPILTLCIMEATLRFVYEKDTSPQEVLSNSLLVIIVGELLLICFTPFVHFFSVEMRPYWGWFVVIFFGYNLNQVFSQFVKGIGYTRKFAYSGVLHTFIIVASNIIGLVFLKKGLNAYLFSMVLGYYATTLYLIISAKIKVKIGVINLPLLKEMLKFSIPTIPAIITWWVSTSADKYIIIGYLGMAASGVYSIAYKIPSILTIFTNIFTSAWTLSAIENNGKEGNAQFQTTVYKYFNMVNILICSVLILFSQLLGKLLFSHEFYSAWRCVPMLLVAYVFSGLAGFLASSFRAAKCTKGLFTSSVWGALLNIALNFPVIKYYGIMGAACTTMLGFLVVFYIRCFTIKKIVDIKINIKRDSLVYLLLIVEAYIIGNELQYSYIFGIIIFIVIVFIYRKIIFEITNKTFNTLIRRK